MDSCKVVHVIIIRTIFVVPTILQIFAEHRPGNNGGAAEAPGHLPQPRGRAGGRPAVGQGGRASAAGHHGPGQPRQQNVAKSLLIALCYL